MTLAKMIVLALVALSGVLSLLLLVRGLLARATPSQQPYGVGKQEARHDMRVDFVRAGFMVVLTLILLAVYSLIPGQGNLASPVTPPSVTPLTTTAPTLQTDEIGPTTTAEVETATLVVVVSPTAAEVEASQTPTATATVNVTATPDLNTAIVNSPNGLWLREAPGGTQEIELIAHQTELELLAGRETEENLTWQQVRTPTGNEGWVAADFLIFP